MRPPSFVCFCFLACAIVSADASEVNAQTPLGTISGENEGAFDVFRGIPYVEPPGRWQHAVPKRAWSGALSAKVFGSTCFLGGRTKQGLKVSEDCLYLNVWRPAKLSNTSHLPVLVWVHGGGFLMGAGSDARYWGDNMTSAADFPVVQVSFNYRMGILGFYSGPAGSNFGFTDQQMALRWVQKNIGSFGGDAGKVTLIGQSAGAMSVQVHLVAPGSRGLFHRAFLASTVGLHYRNITENEPFVKDTAHGLLCFGALPELENCMLKRPASLLALAGDAYNYILNLQTSCHDCDNALPWTPVLDGDILPRNPVDMIRDGDHAAVPVIVSSVRNESYFFLPDLLRPLEDFSLGYNLTMKLLFRDHADEVKAHYEASSDSAGMTGMDRLVLTSTDALFTCYSRYLARYLSKKSPTYLSLFMHAPSAHADPEGQDRKCTSGATCHAADVGWIFPESAAMKAELKTKYSAEEIDFAATYSRAIRAFAHGKQAQWLPYSEDADEAVQWWDSSGPVMSKQYHKDQCDFIESIGFPADWWTGSMKPSSAAVLV